MEEKQLTKPKIRRRRKRKLKKMLQNERSNITRIASKQVYVLNNYKKLTTIELMVKQLEIRN